MDKVKTTTDKKHTELNRAIKTPEKEKASKDMDERLGVMIAESLERIAKALEEIASGMQQQSSPAFDPRWIRDPPYCPNPSTPPQYFRPWPQLDPLNPIPYTPVNPCTPTPYTPPKYTYTYTMDTDRTR